MKININTLQGLSYVSELLGMVKTQNKNRVSLRYLFFSKELNTVMACNQIISIFYNMGNDGMTVYEDMIVKLPDDPLNKIIKMKKNNLSNLNEIEIKIKDGIVRMCISGEDNKDKMLCLYEDDYLYYKMYLDYIFNKSLELYNKKDGIEKSIENLHKGPGWNFKQIGLIDKVISKIFKVTNGYFSIYGKELNELGWVDVGNDNVRVYITPTGINI